MSEMTVAKQSMAGRVCLVTGASNGIGLETARGLHHQGAQVVMVVRNAARGETARQNIATPNGPAIELETADFASLASVRALAERLLARYPAIHVLVNNAGQSNASFERTIDGFERTWAVNHLAPFLLTNLLLDRLQASAPARIVTVASRAHYRGTIDFANPNLDQNYGVLRAYNQSKLANVMMSLALAARLKADQLTANCLHPGVVYTGIANTGFMPRLMWNVFGPLMLKASAGAEPSLYLASAPELRGVTGRYYNKLTPQAPSRLAADSAAQQKLWEMSRQAVGLPA